MKNKILLGLLVTVCILGVGLFVDAQVEKSQLSEVNEFANLVDGDKDLINKVLDLLSGLSVFGSRQSDNASGYYDVYVENDLTVDSDTILNGTTTPAVNTKFSVSTSLDLTGTSTAKGATQNVISYYTNTGADKIVTWAGIDQSTTNTAFESSYQCGTSTWIGGIEGGSLTATTSATTIASTTIATTFTSLTNLGLVDVEDATGSGLAEDKTKFVLQNDDVFFCTWTPYGATSTASFTSAGGFTGVGRLFMELQTRDN